MINEIIQNEYNNGASYKSKSTLIEELMCPSCLNPQKTFKGEDMLEICSYCKEKFTFLKCYHCKKRIYFKNQNFTDGVNIKCPYLECGKWFCKSSCGVCTQTLNFPDRYQEGSKVKCPFSSCQEEYYKVICPNEKCNFKLIFNVAKEANTKDDLSSSSSLFIYRDGCSVTCRSCSTTFQKLSCYECLRKLVWISPSKMVEGQKIICPYEDCKKCMNKIYCPHCHKSNIFTRGGMEFGTKIKCIYKECSKIFNKIFCPSCTKVNVFTNGKFLEGVRTTCVYSNCQKKFCLVNCHYCKRVNFWLEGDYVIGQNIVCAYSDCKKKIAKVNCPHCAKINVFPNGDYCFGKNYKCVYPNCQQEFANFMCPGCYTCLNLQGKYLEGNKVICGKKDCKVSFLNFRCPHCMQVILDKGSTYKFGQTVVCPYENCSKKFNYIYCVTCRRGIYFKDNNYTEGQMIKCPFIDCNKNYNLVYCSHCEKPVHFSNNITKSLRDEELKCVYSTCEKTFQIMKIHFSHWTLGIAFYPKSGIPFYFNNPTKEVREMNMLNSMVLTENLYKSFGHQIKQIEDIDAQKKDIEIVPVSECILCMSCPKESVFVPCGHRCTCFECAMSTFTRFKKCPLCQTEASSILKKVYD